MFFWEGGRSVLIKHGGVYPEESMVTQLYWLKMDIAMVTTHKEWPGVQSRARL